MSPRTPMLVMVAALLSAPFGCASRYAESARPPPAASPLPEPEAVDTASPETPELAEPLARAGFAQLLELSPAPQPPEASVAWAVAFDQPSVQAFETPAQALAAPVRLRGKPALTNGIELRLKVDGYRSWSLRELERRGLPAERWTLGMLVDELHGLQPGPHRLSVFATTQSGAVVRQPELALKSQRFTVGGAGNAEAPGSSPAQPGAAEPAAFWFGPEGTLNGAAAQGALLQFHVEGRERVWLQVTAPDASRAVHELSAQSYLVSGWMSGDYHFALIEAAGAKALVEQVVTVNLDMPASEAQEGAW